MTRHESSPVNSADQEKAHLDPAASEQQLLIRKDQVQAKLRRELARQRPRLQPVLEMVWELASLDRRLGVSSPD